MPTYGWIVIAVAAVLIVAMAAWGMMKRKQTKQLQGQFGPEYDRTVEASDSKKAAESELAARRERREQLDIRPLSSSARERYTSSGRAYRRSSWTAPTRLSRRRIN